MGWLLSRFFVEKAFSAKSKAFGDQIVSDIKDQFIEKLKVTEWMEQEVIDLAINKVHNIVQKIGYPDKVSRIPRKGAGSTSKTKSLECQVFLGGGGAY